MDRAKEIAKVFREWEAESETPVYEWSDREWDAVEEIICGIYIEDFEKIAILDGQIYQVIPIARKLEEVTGE